MEGFKLSDHSWSEAPSFTTIKEYCLTGRLVKQAGDSWGGTLAGESTPNKTPALRGFQHVPFEGGFIIIIGCDNPSLILCENSSAIQVDLFQSSFTYLLLDGETCLEDL